MALARSARPQHVAATSVKQIAPWSYFEIDKVSGKPGSIQRSTYVTSRYDFTKEESERFFDFLTADIGGLADAVRARYSTDSIKQFDLLPFAKNPLVQLGDRVYCPSYPLLVQKLSTGLHHVHLDPAFFPDSDDRKRYLDYVGVVFEDYVHTLLAGTYPPASGRYFLGGELEAAAKGQKVCDGLILYGSQVIVLETKATLLTADARSGADWIGYLSKVQVIVVDGLEQLEATIQRLESGDMAIPGMPREATAFFPVIVTLEPLVLNTFVYSELDRIARARGVAASGRTRPWQLLHIEELEVACMGVDAGRSLADLLSAKVADDTNVGESFINYCHAKGDNILAAGHHPVLARIFDRLGKQAHEWFSSKARST